MHDKTVLSVLEGRLFGTSRIKELHTGGSVHDGSNRQVRAYTREKKLTKLKKSPTYNYDDEREVQLHTKTTQTNFWDEK